MENAVVVRAVKQSPGSVSEWSPGEKAVQRSKRARFGVYKQTITKINIVEESCSPILILSDTKSTKQFSTTDSVKSAAPACTNS